MSEKIELGLVSNVPIDFSALPKAEELKGLGESNWRVFSAAAAKGPFFNLLAPALQKEEVSR